MTTSINIVAMVRRAYQEHWALGQFNMSNLETLQGIVDAANETRSPVIVGVSMGTLRHVGWSYLKGFIQAARAEATTPLYFHVDHALDLPTIESAIEIGFDSVMIDTSRYPLDQNVAAVRKVVAIAHRRGVGVEAQIGETWDEESGEQVQTRTDPSQVEEFVAATGVDYLAVSFGNTPGSLVGEADVDVRLLREIATHSPVPIVIHGGTSIPAPILSEAIQSGAAKVNIDTAIRKAVTKVLSTQYGVPEVPTDPRKAFKLAREEVRKVVIERMTLFGSVGRAN